MAISSGNQRTGIFKEFYDSHNDPEYIAEGKRRKYSKSSNTNVDLAPDYDQPGPSGLSPSNKRSRSLSQSQPRHHGTDHDACDSDTDGILMMKWIDLDLDLHR